MSLRCRLGIHRWRQDLPGTLRWMREHRVSALGWPGGAGVMYRCERCGKVAW